MSVNPSGFPAGNLGVPPGGGRGGMGMPGGLPGQPESGRKGRRRKGGERPPTRRVAGVRRNIAVLLALGAAAALFLTLSEATPVSYVARTATPVAELTELTADMVEIIEINPAYIEPGVYSDADQETLLATVEAELVGLTTRYPLGAGQQLRPEYFTSASEELAVIGADERLISIPATLSNAVAGNLRPGDLVDVVAVSTEQEIAGVIATGLKVVAVRLSADQLSGLSSEQIGPEGRELRPDELQPVEPIPGMYTLQVPARLVNVIAVASTEGVLHLVYRGPSATDIPTPAASLIEILCQVGDLTAVPQGCEGVAQTGGGAFADPFADSSGAPIADDEDDVDLPASAGGGTGGTGSFDPEANLGPGA